MLLIENFMLDRETKPSTICWRMQVFQFTHLQLENIFYLDTLYLINLGTLPCKVGPNSDYSYIWIWSACIDKDWL